MVEFLKRLEDEWKEHETEFEKFDEKHKKYREKIKDLTSMQKSCLSDVTHYRYQLGNIINQIEQIKLNTYSESHQSEVLEYEARIKERYEQLRNLEEYLPHENGLYLQIVLGSVNVSLLSKQEKYKYKQNYELFKLYVTIVIICFGIILWLFLNFRVTDAIFQFLLVWYYCTLTVREHILMVNGSRIKGWWVIHHFISSVCAGLFLIWPDGFAYQLFRPQYIVFSIYLSLVQFVQYYYQSGTLYRLRALGERRTMDLTVEGFQSWMWKGLSFVFPFLLVAYIFQLYNAITLFKLSFDSRCTDWQVFLLSLIFFILFFGNTSTVAYVLRQKFQKKKNQKRESEVSARFKDSDVKLSLKLSENNKSK